MVAGIILFALVGMVGTGLWSLMTYRQLVLAKRQFGFLSRLQPLQMTEEERRKEQEQLSSIPILARWLDGTPFVQELSVLLYQAGSPYTVADLLTMMMIGIVLGAALAIWLHLGVGIGFCVMGGGFFAPTLWLRRIAQARARKFESQMIEAMEILSIYLKVGRSLPQAFMATSEEIAAPASEDFALAAEEYRLGRPLEVALKRVAMRYPDSKGFRLFVVAVGLLSQTGGNMVDILERIKKMLNANLKFYMKLNSATAEARLSAKIIGAIPLVFAVILTLMKPNYLSPFVETASGRVGLAALLTCWGGGILWVRQLISRRVT